MGSGAFGLVWPITKYYVLILKKKLVPNSRMKMFPENDKAQISKLKGTSAFRIICSKYFFRIFLRDSLYNISYLITKENFTYTNFQDS